MLNKQSKAQNSKCLSISDAISSACKSQKDSKAVKSPEEAPEQRNPEASLFTGEISGSMARNPEGDSVGQGGSVKQDNLMAAGVNSYKQNKKKNTKRKRKKERERNSHAKG